MKILKPKQIIVALDFNSIEEANSIVKLLDPETYRLKSGKQLFAAEGPKIIENFNKKGFDIFLDLKLHDIPNTVYKALKNLLNHKSLDDKYSSAWRRRNDTGCKRSQRKYKK